MEISVRARGQFMSRTKTSMDGGPLLMKRVLDYRRL